MEFSSDLVLVLFFAAFLMEIVDSGLGMGYGTVLAPVLLIAGFSPVIVVPAILLSQAFGGFTAACCHHKFKNVSFAPQSRNLKIAVIVSILGIAGSMVAATIALSIPKTVVKTYIGILVIIIGITMLLNFKFKFSFKKIILLGIIGAFNKGISGGGFGPVMTAGQIVVGEGEKKAIAVTTFAEAPICIAAFLIYFMQNPFATVAFKQLTATLLLGAICAAPFGAAVTKSVGATKLFKTVAIFVLLAGVAVLLKTFLWS